MDLLNFSVLDFRKESSNSVEKVVTSSIKVKQTSPKVMYVHDEEKEEQARLRKLGKSGLV